MAIVDGVVTSPAARVAGWARVLPGLAGGGEYINTEVDLSSEPLFSAIRAVLRCQREDDAAFARRVDRAAEILRQTALDHCAGHYPKLVVHFSEDRTEAVVNCTVVSWR